MERLPLSDTCYLRPLEDSDLDEVHALIEADRDYLARWMPWAPKQTVEDTLNFIRASRRQLAEENGLQAAIVCEGEIVGVIGYHAIDWKRRATSIGYWLGEKHQGRGTMTRAVRALVDHALSVWKLSRVEIRVATKNSRSRAIPERLGFRWERTLRRAEKVGNRYLDNDVYVMVASEWKGRGELSRADPSG